MKAIIKTYPTNAEIFVDDANDNRHISVSYDFQDPNFFETKEEMRELIDEWLEEIKDVENYEEIAQALRSILKNIYLKNKILITLIKRI